MTKQSTPILLMLLLFAAALAAQQRQLHPQPLRQVAAPAFHSGGQLEERATTDTLGPPAFADECALELISFGITDTWGTVSGMNEYGDKEKAQLIRNMTNTAITINEAWALFNDASVVGNGNLRMKVYSVNAADGSPDNVLGQSDDITADQIAVDPQLVLITSFPFSNPVTLSDTAFFLSVDFSDLYTAADTAGLLQTDLGCGSGAQAYELWSDDTWISMRESWSDDESTFDANLALLAVIEFEPVSAVHDPFYQQGHLRLFPAAPNPARSLVRLNYELEAAGPVQIEVYSSDGRRLRLLNLGLRSNGRYTEEVDLSGLPAGAYVYSITTDGARVLSKFVVE